jgi:hypothetical protein
MKVSSDSTGRVGIDELAADSYARSRTQLAAPDRRRFHNRTLCESQKHPADRGRLINAPAALLLRSDCASAFHKAKHSSEPSSLTQRNTKSPPFAPGGYAGRNGLRVV